MWSQGNIFLAYFFNGIYHIESRSDNENTLFAISVFGLLHFINIIEEVLILVLVFRI